MIIGISGKLGSGKDTVGKIIQYLTSGSADIMSYEDYQTSQSKYRYDSTFVIKKFADKLKDTVCLWTGCTRKQLEDQEFKDREIGPDWVRYAKAIGFGTRDGERIMWSNTCTKEEYEEELRVNWQTAYKKNLTYRDLLQLVGTECMRNTIHINGWVNSLMSEYKPEANKTVTVGDYSRYYPNWIITDVRFPNELEAIKDKEGITIRVNRPKEPLYLYCGEKLTLKELFEECHKDTGEYPLKSYADDYWLIKPNEHESETALDDAKFHYIINNDGTIEDLVEKVREILIKARLI